jgi:tetratricopeptide (TPR) repeat protein
MILRRQPPAALFLGACLALLLITGLGYRFLHPSLIYSTDMPRKAAPLAPERSQNMENPDHTHPQLSPEDATELAQKMALLRRESATPALLLEISDIFTRNKDWINAVRFLQRLAALTPEDPQPFQLLGIAFTAGREYAQAASAYEKVLVLDPDHVAAQFNLGLLYRDHLQNRDKARELLRRAADSPATGEDLKARARRELDTP